MNAVIGTRVHLVGSHPHRGEEGVVKSLDGPQGMILIRLENCPDWTEECFATPEHLRIVTKKLRRFTA